VDRPHGHLADLELGPVGERVERVLRLSERMDRDGNAMLERKAPVARDVVCVRVRLDRPDDAHAVGSRGLDVLLDRVRRVDDDRDARLRVTDQIGRTAEVTVDELTEQHEPKLSAPSANYLEALGLA